MLSVLHLNGFVHVLAVYSIIHILYNDLGLEFDSKYSRVIKHPFVVFLLIASLAYTEMDRNLYRTSLVLAVFYGSRYLLRNIKDEIFDSMFPPE